MTKRAAVFVSGSGTNQEALLKRQEAGDLEAQIVTVISDRPDAFGLTRARDHGISSHYVQAKGRDKKDYESEVLDILRRAEVELIILAGYMRFVGPTLLAAYPNAIINIHPAYLPEFPGAHGILDAWNAGVKETGGAGPGAGKRRTGGSGSRGPCKGIRSVLAGGEPGCP